MKNEDIYNSISEIDGQLINEAENHSLGTNQKSRIKKRLLISALSAALAVILVVGVVLHPHDGHAGLIAHAIAHPEYPEMLQYPEISDENKITKEIAEKFIEWENSVEERTMRSTEYADGMDSFYKKVMPELLSGSKDGNAVFSPAGMYLALGMLAECTDGNSLAQILDLLGQDGIGDARNTSHELWLANYIDDGITKSVIGNSIWLNEEIDFKKKTLDSIAENYYASSFSGKMGSKKMNELLREWLNKNTGEMLTENVKDIEMRADTAIALANTLCFSAVWDKKFSETNTREDIFHAQDGDVSTEYMSYNGYSGKYLSTDKFEAADFKFDFGGNMTFWLPNEGVSTDDLLRDSESMEIISRGSLSSMDSVPKCGIYFKVPKFDITSSLDMISSLKELGVNDIFDSDASDFTPLYKDTQISTFVSAIENAARVKIDENGCEGASYTDPFVTLRSDGPYPFETNFILDRPFIFTVTGPTGDILFAGTVGDPTK